MPTINVHLGNIDMDQLYEQKLQLIKAMNEFSLPDCLEGLVNMIDHIGDDAEARGLWKYPDSKVELAEGDLVRNANDSFDNFPSLGAESPGLGRVMQFNGTRAQIRWNDDLIWMDQDEVVKVILRDATEEDE